jgi:hypothetical protein
MGFYESLLKTPDLVLDFFFGDFAAGDDVAGAMENENLPAANSG